MSGLDIRTKIKKLAGTHETENVTYAIGEVMYINDGTDQDYPKNTCQVKLISSKSISGEINFPDKDLSGNEISDTLKASIQSEYEGLILKNVALSVNGSEDESITIPVIGSQVVLMMSNYQQPLIVQYSNVNYQKTTYTDAVAYSGQTIDGGNGFEWSIINGHSYLELVPHAGATSQGSFEVLSDRINLTNNNGSSGARMQINDNLAGIQYNNVEMTVLSDNHFRIKNSSESFAYLMADMIAIISAAQAPPGGSGGPLILITPLTLPSGNIAAAGPISVPLTALQIRINTLISI